MNSEKIDKLIKSSIVMDLRNYQLNSDVLSNIKCKMKIRKRQYKHKSFMFSLRYAKSMQIASVMFILVIFLSLSFLISPNLRTFASDAINSIRTRDEVISQSIKDGLKEITDRDESTKFVNDKLAELFNYPEENYSAPDKELYIHYNESDYFTFEYNAKIVEDYVDSKIIYTIKITNNTDAAFENFIPTVLLDLDFTIHPKTNYIKYNYIDLYTAPITLHPKRSSSYGKSQSFDISVLSDEHLNELYSIFEKVYLEIKWDNGEEYVFLNNNVQTEYLVNN